MKDKNMNLPLRSGVGIVVLNKKNQVFVAKRIDNQKNFWQMPQGGVDKGENYLAAAYRELKEETSIKNVELVKELNGLISYELPKNLKSGDKVRIYSAGAYTSVYVSDFNGLQRLKEYFIK